MLIAQDRHSIDFFSRREDGNWLLTSCQALDENVELSAIDSQLKIAEVYDKVTLPAQDTIAEENPRE